MSDRNFSRRRRGGMRFRPRGGVKPNQKPRPRGQEARAEAIGDKVRRTRTVYDKPARSSEIERAENVAAGLPPEGAASRAADAHGTRKRFPRTRTWKRPREVKEETVSSRCRFKDQPTRASSRTIKAAANKVIQKVQRLIKPEKQIHKEVIINAESLETRVAVLEEGKLEEFTIERTTEERLVGSIFKGKVRNLEDGLKAAFVDIGFEKNAFLHYWDIVPSNFDSGVEIVEREGERKRDKPRITQKDIPAPLSARQRHHRPGDQRPDRHQRPARHDQPRPARPLPRAAAEFGSKRHLPQNRKPGRTPAPEEDSARA